MSNDDQQMDMLVPRDQGPSTEAAGVIHPEGAVTREDDHRAPERGDYPDADQDTGVDDQGRAPRPTSGDTSVPGEVEGEGNSAGLQQGVNGA